MKRNFTRILKMIAMALACLEISAEVREDVLVLPHYAIGAGWESVVKVANRSSYPQLVNVKFFGIHGLSQVILIEGLGNVKTATRVIPANGTWELNLTRSDGVLIHGCITVHRPSTDVVASVMFRSKAPDRTDFEAVVPGVLMGEKFRMSFDNTNGYSTGIAVQNLDLFMNLLNVTIYDENGSRISDHNFTGLMQLEGNDRMVFKMTDLWPFAAGKRGTIVFDNYRHFAVMGLLFNAGGAFTALGTF